MSIFASAAVLLIFSLLYLARHFGAPSLETIWELIVVGVGGSGAVLG